MRGVVLCVSVCASVCVCGERDWRLEIGDVWRLVLEVLMGGRGGVGAGVALFFVFLFFFCIFCVCIYCVCIHCVCIFCV